MDGHMSSRRLIGLGLFMGFGLGQTFAWLLLRGECSSAPAMIALSTFGPGMSLCGVLMTLLYTRRGQSA